VVVVPDSNILARAFISALGPARKLVQRLTSETGALVLSRHILGELARVLNYPRIQRRLVRSPDIVEYLEHLANAARIVVPELVPSELLRDPTDAPVIGTALAGRADVLCTRDLDLQQPPVVRFAASRGIQILSDVELLAFFDQRVDQAD
jgi:putative PIN family toxin of toxin-antitoxin system